MKKYLLAGFLFAVTIVHAQVKQGTIVYERKIDVHRRMEDEQMKAMMPQFRSDKHELLFDESVSVYKAVEEEEAPDPFDDASGNRVVLRFGAPGDDGILYKNFITQKLLRQTSLGDKEYIIDDTIGTQQWKLGDETKTILNHTCKKAMTKTERGSDVTAWYAEDIPVAAGPENFGGLPGVILMLDINNGEIVFTATEIKTNVGAKNLKEPSRGKHISRAEFDKKVDEAFGPADSKGRRIITREN